jgi:hypothetical protein
LRATTRQYGVPSDFDGVNYETDDDLGAWKVKLAKELEAAGFNVVWSSVHGAFGVTTGAKRRDDGVDFRIGLKGLWHDAATLVSRRVTEALNTP